MEFLGRSVPVFDVLVLLLLIYFWILGSCFALPFVSIVVLCSFKITAIKRNIALIATLVEKRSKKEKKKNDDLILPNDYIVIDLDNIYERPRDHTTSGGNSKNAYPNGSAFVKFETSVSHGVNFSDEKEATTGEQEQASTSQGTPLNVFKDETAPMPFQGDNGSYNGEINEGMYHGHGVETWGSEGTYKGQFNEGFWHGFGEYCANNGDRYEGAWQFGLKNGTGQQYSFDGSLYTGQFKNGTRHGLGWTRHRYGDWYAGEHEKGDMHGLGAYHFFNGDVFEGTWNEGNMHGYGCYRCATGENKSGIWEHNVLRVPIPDSHWPINRTIELVRLSALSAFLVKKVDEEVRAAVIHAEKAAALI